MRARRKTCGLKEAKMFNPDLTPGQTISNRQLLAIFHCACEGGIRYSSKTGTVVVVVNNTKKGLPNVWENGLLRFAGRPLKSGDRLQGANLRLDSFLREGGDVFLFEVNSPGLYEYKGPVKLAGAPAVADAESGARYPVFPLSIESPQ